MIRLISTLRSFIMVFVFVAVTAVLSSLLVIQDLFIGKRKISSYIIKIWTRSTLWMFGISVIEHGRQNIPEKGCLYLFNHTSFFDIFVLQARVPRLRFGAKIELFSIPFFGKAMARAGVLPIARGNLEEVIKVYKNAENKAAEGQQYALAPEGTRNTEEQLMPFKAGPFIFAINAKIPVVPVVIKNAHQILPKHGILPNTLKWKQIVEIYFLPMIEVADLKVEDRTLLQEKVFNEMKPFFKS